MGLAEFLKIPVGEEPKKRQGAENEHGCRSERK
jgi:hypothetical protein